jgi:hypothetical protein
MTPDLRTSSGSIDANVASTFPDFALDEDVVPFDDEHPATRAAMQAAVAMSTLAGARFDPTRRVLAWTVMAFLSLAS